MLYFFCFLFVGSFSTPTFIIEPKKLNASNQHFEKSECFFIVWRH